MVKGLIIFKGKWSFTAHTKTRIQGSNNKLNLKIFSICHLLIQKHNNILYGYDTVHMYAPIHQVQQSLTDFTTAREQKKKQ